VNFQGAQFSKVSRLARVALILLCPLPGRLGAEAALPVDTATRITDTLSGCARPRTELRFEMLATGAEPSVPAAHGLQVCLAVYRRDLR